MGQELPIMESFLTIQGEGYHSGKPAFFIRTGGCDVGCVWCDVKESWNAENHPVQHVTALQKLSLENESEWVVLTGGEPAMYKLQPLVGKLKEIKRSVAIETSGCYPLDAHVDWYTFSPKKFKKPCAEAYEKADELKIVVYHKSDFRWALKHAEKVSSTCLLYIQPEWSKKEELMAEIVDFVKSNKGWRISLQTHKFMNIP
ncbi:MAG: 7-carboxy-7-deazaguanine synthase QueE [Crocinitomicaceae bacterium TMED16]|nr:7-carboxy-7-deazaguanine synthase QueE [Crocinitomicaceae bacterium]OUT68967.1 MAG: 7-carboxy-7-deazaguanine synthase QueE [Crocinitomicaceae bacterium TMED16]|tara:strand:+ start:5937 stop:6539 length:603 start_codon:yes stop_codon:yes gene_type:complete